MNLKMNWTKLGFLLFLLSTLTSCVNAEPGKNQSSEKIALKLSVKTVAQNDAQKDDCLAKKDTSQIVSFLAQAEQAILGKDTSGLIRLINFPIVVDGDSLNKQAFVKAYYKDIATYLLRSTMNRDEVFDLNRTEQFVSKTGLNGCYRYLISNSFSELEFTIKFNLEKRNGQILIVAMSVIG